MIVVIKTVREATGRVRYRFRERVMEWQHSFIATFWGAIVLAHPDGFTGPAFSAFSGAHFWVINVDAPHLWGGIMLGVGLMRLSALGINGYMSRPTAMARVLGSLSGIALFAAIALGLLFSWTWPPGLAVYATLGFFSLFSLYWAIFDVAIPGDGHNVSEPAG